MPFGTKVLKKLTSNDSGNEYAYYTEEMLDENVAIKEVQFSTNDGAQRTMLSVLYDAEDYTEEFHLYIGTRLAPVQIYRIARDITDLYKSCFLEDFLEIVEEHLSIDKFSTKGKSEQKTTKLMNDDIKRFFEQINQ